MTDPADKLRAVVAAYDKGEWTTGGDLLEMIPEADLRALLAEYDMRGHNLDLLRDAIGALQAPRSVTIGTVIARYPDKAEAPLTVLEVHRGIHPGAAIVLNAVVEAP